MKLERPNKNARKRRPRKRREKSRKRKPRPARKNRKKRNRKSRKSRWLLKSTPTKFKAASSGSRSRPEIIGTSEWSKIASFTCDGPLETTSARTATMTATAATENHISAPTVWKIERRQ